MSEKFQTPCWLSMYPVDQKISFVVVVMCIDASAKYLNKIEQIMRHHKIVITDNKSTGDHVIEYFINTEPHKAWILFGSLLGDLEDIPVDIAVLPVSDRRKKLLLCDMDSTIVASETLDDIAARVGIGDQVARITASAMRGDLDFRQALIERVALLKDQPVEILYRIAEQLRLNPGAEQLIRQANKHNFRTVLVSGGFEPIVKAVAHKLEFDHFVCNNMEVFNDCLTGKVLNPIVDSETKLDTLLQECQYLNITTDQACAIGDGANDFSMLSAAGLGISYHGKPLLRESLAYQINHHDLDSALSIMGIFD